MGRVVAAFDGGAITSGAGGLLLGAASSWGGEPSAGSMDRSAECFHDARNGALFIPLTILGSGVQSFSR